MSQRWIGRQVGLSQAQVWKRMNGRIEWRNSELQKLADALGVPVATFLKGKPERAA